MSTWSNFLPRFISVVSALIRSPRTVQHTQLRATESLSPLSQAAGLPVRAAARFAERPERLDEVASRGAQHAQLRTR